MSTRQKTAGKKTRIPLSLIYDELRATLLQLAPFIAEEGMKIFRELEMAKTLSDKDLDGLRKKHASAIAGLLQKKQPSGTFETWPGSSARDVFAQNSSALQQAIEAAYDRCSLRTSLTAAEKLEIFTGMLRTRLLDARLKKFFSGSEIKTPQGIAFQGKGFRSTGQEGIYAAAVRLRRGPDYSGPDGEWHGDLVTPMIRDLGLALAMGLKPADVIAAQMGKPGKPTFGKDLHIGDFSIGILPPAAPIGLSSGTACGLGLAVQGTGRVVLNCIGDGGTSTGEWHEAINFSAVRKLPVVFIVQNNQTALSTPTEEQFACSRLAERGPGYGIPSITIDGTDPEAIFAAVTQAVDRCRAGAGPALIELVAMRMCGHAHHDDMLYFGHEPDRFFEYPELKAGGYIDPDRYAYWSRKDPISTYEKQLIRERVLTKKQAEELRSEIEKEIEAAAQEVIAMPWPEATHGMDPVFSGGPRAIRRNELAGRDTPWPPPVTWHPVDEPGFTPDPGGQTYWQAIVEALAEEMERDPGVFILGEDVGGSYGNAFVILKSLLERFGERMLNTPLSESAIIGAATGAALLGKRPVAEIQFNDFIASGFNQLVNNTAKIFFRWNHAVPLTIRMPWGGLRQAGPYHSQDTEPWFYRTPGLKIVSPSTPREAKALLKAAIRDDNPVLFYEHIALYRDAHIKEKLPDADTLLPLGTAHLKRDGRDLTLITWGAYTHICLAVAEKVAREDGLSCQVLDLRSIQPLDHEAILACTRKTGRVLIVQEDSKTGGIGQSVAAIIAEQAFEYLDAPVQVIAALDTPVPYSPPLEQAFLASEQDILHAVRLLAAY